MFHNDHTISQAVYKRFPGSEFMNVKQTFKFSCSESNSNPAIKIDFSNRLKSGWLAGKLNLSNKVGGMSDNELINGVCTL